MTTKRTPEEAAEELHRLLGDSSWTRLQADAADRRQAIHALETLLTHLRGLEPNRGNGGPFEPDDDEFHLAM